MIAKPHLPSQNMHRSTGSCMPHHELPHSKQCLATSSCFHSDPLAQHSCLTSLMMMSTFSGSCTVSMTPWMTVIWSASCRQRRSHLSRTAQ